MEIMQIGLGFFVSDVSDTVALIERAERAGVPAVWAAMPVTSYDTPTLFAAALPELSGSSSAPRSCRRSRVTR
jgi:hypothetical protein